MTQPSQILSSALKEKLNIKKLNLIRYSKSYPPKIHMLTLTNVTRSSDSYTRNFESKTSWRFRTRISIPVRQLDVLLFVPVHIDRKHQLLDGWPPFILFLQRNLFPHLVNCDINMTDYEWFGTVPPVISTRQLTFSKGYFRYTILFLNSIQVPTVPCAMGINSIVKRLNHKKDKTSGPNLCQVWSLLKYKIKSTL